MDNPVYTVTETDPRPLEGVVQPTQPTLPCKTTPDKADMASCRWRFHWFINAAVVLSLIGLIAVLEMGVVPFQKLGFYCNDPKLSFKYNGDTITVGMLFSTAFLLPLVSFLLVELLIASMAEVYKTKDKKLDLAWLKVALHWYGQFVLGLLIVVFFIEAGKTVIKEPRPHFLDTCRPDTGVNCTAGYIATYKCTNGSVTRLQREDSARSFPSGHAAIGVYTGVYMILYFQRRVPDSSYLVVPWLQCMFGLWSILCALTRVTDRRHHWWDVVVGSLCGLAIAVYSTNVYARGFAVRCKSPKPEKKLSDAAGNGRYTSSRRLLSSTSSYTPPDDRELREVQVP